MLRTMNHLQITGQCCWKRCKSACQGNSGTGRRDWHMEINFYLSRFLWMKLNEAGEWEEKQETWDLTCLWPAYSKWFLLLTRCCFGFVVLKCQNTDMGGRGWRTLTRTHSVPVAILPATFLTHDHFSSLTICWLMWTFNSWYFSHSMARFSYSIQIQCSMMLLPCLFLLKMHSFYYTALYLP